MPAALECLVWFSKLIGRTLRSCPTVLSLFTQTGCRENKLSTQHWVLRCSHPAFSNACVTQTHREDTLNFTMDTAQRSNTSTFNFSEIWSEVYFSLYTNESKTSPFFHINPFKKRWCAGGGWGGGGIPPNPPPPTQALKKKAFSSEESNIAFVRWKQYRKLELWARVCGKSERINLAPGWWQRI